MREKKQSVDNLIWLAIAMEKKAKKPPTDSHPNHHRFTSSGNQFITRFNHKEGENRIKKRKKKCKKKSLSNIHRKKKFTRGMEEPQLACPPPPPATTLVAVVSATALALTATCYYAQRRKRGMEEEVVAATGEGDRRNMERRTGWSGWPIGAAPVRFTHHLHLHRRHRRCSRWGKASSLLPVVRDSSATAAASGGGGQRHHHCRLWGRAPPPPPPLLGGTSSPPPPQLFEREDGGRGGMNFRVRVSINVVWGQSGPSIRLDGPGFTRVRPPDYWAART